MKRIFGSGIVNLLVSLLLVCFVYRGWFTGSLVFGGDHFFPPYSSMVSGLADRPYAWDPFKGNGLGGVNLGTLWIDTYAQVVPNLLQRVGIPPAMTQKVVFTWLFLVLGFVSISFFSRVLFGLSGLTGWYSGVLYLTNTYILMVMSGGQFGIGMAYAIAPLVLGLTVLCLRGTPAVSPPKLSYLLGFVISIQIFFDLRLTYITLWMVLGACIAYIILSRPETRMQQLLKVAVRIGVLPAVVAVLPHMFWLLPLLVYRVNPVEQLGAAYTSISAVRFFSFADYSHAFTWLHPNWPENIFGKTYFLQPEFLIVPIVVFSALWVIPKVANLEHWVTFRIRLLMLLALIGIFLSKGTQEPLGFIYLWLYTYIPGFFLFRDPTKFYLVTAIAYSVLIPISLALIYRWVSMNPFMKTYVKSRWVVQGALLVVAIGWLVLIRQSITGEIRGTFYPKRIAPEYGVFAEHMHADTAFYRTLWLPRHHFASYFDVSHPVVDADLLIPGAGIYDTIEYLQLASAYTKLSDIGVRYIVVPYDTEQNIFTIDRKYDHAQYTAAVETLSTIPWLTKVNGYGSLGVFELKRYLPKFSLTRAPELRDVAYTMHEPTRFTVELPAGSSLLRFNERYAPGWVLRTGSRKVTAVADGDGMMEFPVAGLRDSVEIYFEPQQLLERSGLIAIVMLIILSVGVLFF